MSLITANLDPMLQAGSGLAARYFCWQAWRQIPWMKWRAPTVFSAWCASVIVLVLLWRMRIPILQGVELHLLGLALYCLMFARPLATLGIATAVMAYTLEYQGNWRNLGVNILLFAVFPAWLSAALLDWSRRFLPRHLFVFLLGNGFFFTVLVNASVALLSLLTYKLIPPYRGVAADAYAYALLLSWGEAFLSGFLITIFTIYRPEWVLSFDDQIYLSPNN